MFKPPVAGAADHSKVDIFFLLVLCLLLLLLSVKITPECAYQHSLIRVFDWRSMGSIWSNLISEN